MEIVFGEITLILLAPKELNMLVYNTQEFEDSFGVSYKSQPLKGEFYEVLKIKDSIVANSPEDYVFLSLWLILVKNVVVGTIGFKGQPTPEGIIEIGYGVGEQFRGLGYATHAVKALVSWVVQRSDVEAVVAETLPENIPSQRVLIKAGFHRYETAKENLWWIYK